MGLLDKFKKSSENDEGVKLANLGKYQEALICFDKEVKLEPKHFQLWFNKASGLLNLWQI